VTERAERIKRVRDLAVACARAWVAQRAEPKEEPAEIEGESTDSGKGGGGGKIRKKKPRKAAKKGGAR
jgi:hypothetical protein